MMHLKYMRYTDNIDKYLQNSPNPMIKHCLLKKGRGDNMDKIGIKITSVGKFSVCSYKNDEKRLYSLDFGVDEGMAYCTSTNWKMLAYRCKHLFYSFNKFIAWV